MTWLYRKFQGIYKAKQNKSFQELKEYNKVEEYKVNIKTSDE